VQIQKYYSDLKIFWLSIISLGFFWVINTRFESLNSNTFISQRWLGISFITVYILSCIFFAATTFIRTKNRSKSFLILIELLIVGLTSMLFATIIDWQILFEYEIPGRKITIHSGYICIPLFVLNFWTFWNVFKSKVTNSTLLFLQVFLAALCTFSFVDLLSLDRSSIRVFNIDYLSILVSINPIFWVLTSIGIISFFTISKLSLASRKQKIMYVGIVFFVMAQWIFLLNIAGIKLISFPNFIYIHKAILFMILWDFVYKAIVESLSQDSRSMFVSRTIGNALYHFAIASIALFIFLI
jgi:hypothetical protein